MKRSQKWLGVTNNEIQEYKNDLENTKKRIKELEEETKDLEKIDLEQLNRSIQELETKQIDFQGKLESCKAQYENHNRTFQDIRSANHVLKDTESAWRSLKKVYHSR